MSKGLQIKYFVLNPTSSDSEFAYASIEGMRAFAERIAASNPELCRDLLSWSDEAELEMLGRKKENSNGC